MEPDSGSVTRLLGYIGEVGLTPLEGQRGWPHIGAVICDAALQPRTRYAATVLPRVHGLIAAWPDADTVSLFAKRLAEGDVAEVLRWRGPRKLEVIHSLTRVLQDSGVETVLDLRERLSSPDTASELRARLRSIRGVGPKTVDYIAILAGVRDRAAIDFHVNDFVKAAGVRTRSYKETSALLIEVARNLGWDPASLDGAIWQHMSTKA